MTSNSIDVQLSAANPLSDRDAAALSLHDAEVELIERIVAIPVRRRVPPVATRVLRRRRLVLALGVAVTIVAALMLAPSGDQGGGPAPAFAAPLVRFANASPLALLRLPGWHVVYADEQANGFGEMHFVRGPADSEGNPRGASFRNQASLAGRVASLTWSPVDPASPRYITGGHQTATTGLGVTARRFIYEGGSAKGFDITAQFFDRGRILSFRATVSSMAMFRAELRALSAVDTVTWLRAMPASVVKAADSGEAVRVMLRGIPLPPGFDAARIRGVHLVHDRYQLGAAVTGTVACMWIADWNHARATGDTKTVTRAIAAMATASRWPVLRQMAQEGAWPQVMIDIAKAMPRGALYGRRPLVRDVDSGLGCGSQWGINLWR
jgi:hypothetical protein